MLVHRYQTIQERIVERKEAESTIRRLHELYWDHPELRGPDDNMFSDSQLNREFDEAQQLLTHRRSYSRFRPNRHPTSTSPANPTPPRLPGRPGGSR